jgi:hypothetical protein
VKERPQLRIMRCWKARHKNGKERGRENGKGRGWRCGRGSRFEADGMFDSDVERDS